MTHWSWTCPDCGETMLRAAVADHRAAHALGPARGLLVGMALGALGWVALIVVIVWAVRR